MKPMKDLLDGVTDPNLKRQLASLGERIAAREDDPPESDKAQRPLAKVIQLPLWPEPTRGVPNSALRGTLFAAIQGKDRRYIKRELLAVQQGIEIRFTGMQLDQSDLDVWEQSIISRSRTD